jgi:hypothetical protein
MSSILLSLIFIIYFVEVWRKRLMLELKTGSEVRFADEVKFLAKKAKLRIFQDYFRSR